MTAMLERIEASWQELLTAVDGIPDARLAEPGVTGDWSVKDILTHIAYWEGDLVQTAERTLAGETAVSDDTDVDLLNQRAYEDRRDWSVERVWDDLHRGHERMVTSIRACPSLTEDEVKVETWEHYEDHIASIRAWRARVGV